MLLALSLLGNAVAVALGLWGWRAGRQNIAERLYVAPNRARRRSFFECSPIEKDVIVVLGDSITAGAQWGEMLPGRPVKNRGIGGDTTATLLDRLPQVSDGRPATVLLMVGTNDLGTNVAHDRIVANYAAILDHLRAASPGTVVVVHSVLPRGVAFVERVRGLNLALAQLAATHEYPFVDLTPVFASSHGTMVREFSNDELHLLGPGYVAWQRAIAPYLSPVDRVSR
jgi:lysophospholipase L1-like esterase